MLVPWAAVEVKDGQAARPEATLSQLAALRDQIGTVDHYVVTNDEWFRARPTMRDVESIHGPAGPEYGSRGTLHNLSLATALISEHLSDAAKKRKASGVFNPLELFIDVVPGRLGATLRTLTGDEIPVDQDVLWRAGRRALHNFTLRDRSSALHLSHPALARAVAELAGDRLMGSVVDPFCGAGEFLWAAADRAESLGRHVGLHGMDVSDQMVAIASSFAAVAPYRAAIHRGDAYVEPMPEANLVLTAPPVGLRVAEPVSLLDGSKTRDGELAAIDVTLRSLQPGGRAVIQVSPSAAARPDGEGYRRFLADRYRIGALIGCPTGSIPGAAVGAVLMVFDKKDPTDTFVAQLSEDWESQLSADGAAMSAAMAHLDGQPSPL